MRSRRSSSDSQPTKVGTKFLMELSASFCGQNTCIWLLLISVGDGDTDVNLLTAALLPIIWLICIFPFTLLLTSIKYIIMKVSRCNGYLAAFGAVLAMICIGLLLLLVDVHCFDYDDTQNFFPADPSNLKSRNSSVLMDIYILFLIFISTSCLFELFNRFLPVLNKSRVFRFCLFVCTLVMASLTLMPVICSFT